MLIALAVLSLVLFALAKVYYIWRNKYALYLGLVGRGADFQDEYCQVECHVE